MAKGVWWHNRNAPLQNGCAVKESDLRRLAEQGNPQAIAQVLRQAFQPHQIRVMLKRVTDKHLKIQLEGFNTPDQAIAKQILTPWQKIWEHTITETFTVEGIRFGEVTPDWEWTIVAGLLSPAEREPSPEALSAQESPKKAALKNDDLTLKLRQLLAAYLWSIKVTPSAGALVIKLTVIDQRDSQDYCQIIQQALQHFSLDNVEKVYLNVYHRQQRQYLLKTCFSLHGALPSQIPNPRPRSRQLHPDTPQALLIGGGLGLILFLLPPSRFILNTFLTLVHEIGHAIAFWLFGYPAVPSFDFIFGGGITLALGRASIILWLLYGAIAYLAWQYRRNRGTLITLAGLTLLQILLILTGWDQIAIIAMGHLLEIAAVFICLYFALGKYFCHVSGEQTLYALLASFSFLENSAFFGQLMTSETFRIAYRVGKGGLLDHDLVRLTQDFFAMSLSTLAGCFLLLTFLAPVLAFGAFYWESRWVPQFYRLCQPSPKP
ncbi:hypothetical protein [Picosynechococcus sp. PCC 8807]|uniref:hypothetical protein n=1 Tax=Picosynechococcus sp. PCC 8807 TaxID=195248 RepID=UPI0008103FE0|nr:hypothetical protein AWQ24_01710 [Picosynechococcus sp. PCC 8807]